MGTAVQFVLIPGIDLIDAERVRQIEEEGWTPKHDDEHRDAQLAWAAVCYAAPRSVYRVQEQPTGYYHDPWPWDDKWDKRGQHSRIRQLAIAGALIAAEIERLQRIVIGDQGNDKKTQGMAEVRRASARAGKRRQGQGGKEDRSRQGKAH